MKKFKDTKVGGWLKTNAPKVLNVVGDLLPTNGVFGVVKNMINMTGEVPPEKVIEFETMREEFEKEIFAMELADKASARNREVEFVKATGKIDRFMTTIGVFILFAFGFCMYITVFVELKDAQREMFIEVRATVRDLLIGLGTYYWGSSAGSRIKDMRGHTDKQQ
jgi:hypothetical protein